MVREIKAAPLLFGYRGSELVDIEPVEDLLLRLAQLKNDLPQVRDARPVPGARGADGVDGAHAPSARVEPVVDARSDWFVRRTPQRASRGHSHLGIEPAVDRLMAM